MDRLIALVLVRWRMDLRALGFARERAVALLVMVPAMIVFSGLGAILLFFAVRSLASGDPALLAPALSALATVVGFFWMVAPLLSGLSVAESHDVSRLLHFPIPPWTLVASSLLANLAQPTVLAEVPMIIALALAVSDRLVFVPLALLGVLVSFGTILAAAQATSLVLHGLSRRRRFADLSLMLGIGFAFVLSLLPLLLLWGGGRVLGPVVRVVRTFDVFALSPFAWGARAAVHGGQGDIAGFGVWLLAGLLSIAFAMSMSALLIHRIYRGELDIAGPAGDRGRASRMRFGSAIGAVFEKDVAMAWRDPALKASLFMGLVGPVLFLLFIIHGGGRSPSQGLLYLSLFVGVSAFGTNAFGLERRAIALLMGFPVERWRILVGKNLGALIFRLPGLLILAVAALLLERPDLLLPALAIAVSGLVISAGMDNFMAILFPIPHPAPGRNPYSTRGSGRGLGAMAMSFVFLAATMAVAGPFLFLVWLPQLLGRPWLSLFTLPLAVAGAGAAYAMLVAGAARLLERRETDLMERILTEVGGD